MKRFVLFFLLGVILLSGCTLSISEKEGIKKLSGELISAKDYVSTIDLASSVAPAIVGILASSNAGDGVGSGVCVKEGGVIITNSHVINGADDIEVYLHNGDTSKASILWEDTAQDLAIIKTNKTIPYLPIVDDNALNVGEDIVAVGTPLSLILKHSFTKGIVSALNRTLKVDTINGQAYMQNLIQHDASLNPGNSGGPLINLRGEVVGINTLKISGGEGIGFAIPSITFSTLLERIDDNYKTPFLGAFGYDAEIAHFNKLSQENEGFYVVDIVNNGPLDKADIDNGCVITKFNGYNIKNSADMRNQLYKCKYGDEVKVEYVVNGERKVKKIILSKNDLR